MSCGREQEQYDADEEEYRNADQFTASNEIAERLVSHKRSVSETRPGGKCDEAMMGARVANRDGQDDVLWVPGGK